MHLLELVTVLRNAMPKAPSFNLFSALGCETDEVFLHSRFIAAMIGNRHHRFADQALQALLRHLKVPVGGTDGFQMRGVQVRTEFKKIDVLISNDSGQCVIIENKIYALDQPRQLRRYYDEVKSLGYVDIYVRYLTLDGRDPSPDSLGGLEMLLDSPKLDNASYGSEIKLWLDELAALAVRESGLREVIFQYQELIDRLTGRGQEKSYMDELVQTLLTGKNIFAARDIRAAYPQALTALQEKLWSKIIAELAEKHPGVIGFAIKDSAFDPKIREAAIRKYYEPVRNNRWYYGLGISVPGYRSVQVWLHIERALYVGVNCEEGRASAEYQKVAEILKKAAIDGQSNETWPIWCFIRENHNFEQPDDALLTMLCDDQQCAAFAALCTDMLVEIWRRLAK